MTSKRIFINGRVLTMDPRGSIASAFGILGDRFCAVGSDEDLLKQADRDAEVVDLGGRTVVPGFIESHSHLSLYAMTLLQADCKTPPNRSIEDVKSRLGERARGLKPGQWFKGWGYDNTLIEEKRHLTRKDLDEAVPDHPVFVSHSSGHLAYVNSLALDIAGISRNTPQPAGGRIHKDNDGNPTGLLMEQPAQCLVTRHIPPDDVARLKSAMLETMSIFHRYGITSIHDAAIGYFREHREIVEAYRQLMAEGRLKLRVYLMMVEEVFRNSPELRPGAGFESEWFKIGGVKLFQDGSIQAHTAALDEPYHDSHHIRGDLIIEQKTLDELVEKYHGEGIQMAVHCNGERAIESVLDAMEKAASRQPGRTNRHMLIHCQLASRRQIARMKRLGIIPSYFANHIFYWGDRHREIFLGLDRANRIDPLGSTVEAGLRFTLHSDLPVTPVDPLFSMHCAVNRTTRNGVILGPEERISTIEALKAYTVYAAYCSFEEDVKGSIEANKLADFAVLSHSLHDISPERLRTVRVIRTFVGGQKVYEAP